MLKINKMKEEERAGSHSKEESGGAAGKQYMLDLFQHHEYRNVLECWVLANVLSLA